jgi:CHASE1-domain containing sensor protein
VAVVLVLVLGTVLSLGMAFRVRTVVQANRQVEFSQRATAAATALQRSVQAHLEPLYSIGALYAVAPMVKRTEFREFTQGPLKRHAGIEALGWVPRVGEAERETYMTAARQDGIADFQITERTVQGLVVRAARRDVYYPLFYVEPLASNLALVGFNLGLDPSRLDTLQKAINTAEVVASPWTNLGQDASEQFGFFLFLPIYKSGRPHETLEERRAHLHGFALAIFRLSTLVERALRGLALGNMDLRLTDVTDAASRHLLSLQLRTSQTPLLTFVPRHSVEVEAIRVGLHWETTFNVAGRRWSVLASPQREARDMLIWQAWGLLVGGLLLTVLCARVLYQRRT